MNVGGHFLQKKGTFCSDLAIVRGRMLKSPFPAPEVVFDVGWKHNLMSWHGFSKENRSAGVPGSAAYAV